MPVLPMSINEQANPLTCETLDQLIQSANQFQKTLTILSCDLDLQQHHNDVIYALDFSEIYDYLWADKSRPYSSQIIEALLRSQTIKFTLLPGTVVELVRYLKRTIEKTQRASEKLDEYANRPMVAAFMKHFDNARSQDLPTLTELFPTFDETMHSLADVAELETLHARLEHLSNMPNLIPFAELMDEHDLPFQPDPDVFLGCRASLDYRRPGSGNNNFIDAYNFATIHALTKMSVRRGGPVYCLVTSSPVASQVFRNWRWDPVIGNDVSLVRHPIQVLYHAHLQPLGPNAAHKVSEMAFHLQTLLRYWYHIPEYRTYQQNRSRAHHAIAMPEDRTYLMACMDYMQRYESVFLPVRCAIEADIVAEREFSPCDGL